MPLNEATPPGISLLATQTSDKMQMVQMLSLRETSMVKPTMAVFKCQSSLSTTHWVAMGVSTVMTKRVAPLSLSIVIE